MKPLISLEDYVSTTGVDNEGADAVEQVADVENAHLELCEHERNVAQISNALLEGCQHYCALREVEAELQKSETFQEPVAKATLLAVEQILSDMGRPKTGKLSLESISETVKDVWQKLLEAFKRAWAAFKKWIDSLLDVCKRLESRAGRMLKELDKYGESSNPQPITNTRMCTFISDRTGTAKAVDVLKDVADTSGHVTTVYGTLLGHMGKIHTAIRSMITAYHRHAKDDPEGGEKAWKSLLAGNLSGLYYDPAFYKAMGSKKSDAPSLQIEHTVLFTYPYPVGNAQFFGRMADTASSLDQHFGSIAHHIGFGVAPHASKHHPDAVEPLPRAAIKAQLEDSQKYLVQLMKIRDDGKKTIANFETLLKDIKRGITVEDVNPAFEAILIKALVQSTTGLLNMTISGERSMRMFQVKLVKQMLEYCALSMRQLTPLKPTPARL